MVYNEGRPAASGANQSKPERIPLILHDLQGAGEFGGHFQADILFLEALVRLFFQLGLEFGNCFQGVFGVVGAGVDRAKIIQQFAFGIQNVAFDGEGPFIGLSLIHI